MNEMSLTTMYGDYAIAKENGYEKSFAQFKNDFGGGPIDYSQEEEIEIKEFANGGGVGSMMQPRQNYAIGGDIQSIINAAYPQGNFLDIRETSPTQKDYNINVTKDLVENLPGGVLRDMLAPAAAATLSVPYDTIQGIGRAVDKSDIDRSPYGGIVDDMETPRGPSLSELGQAINAENPLSSMIERTIGASAPLAERLSGINFGMSEAAASEMTPSGVRNFRDIAGENLPSGIMSGYTQPSADYPDMIRNPEGFPNALQNLERYQDNRFEDLDFQPGYDTIDDPNKVSNLKELYQNRNFMDNPRTGFFDNTIMSKGNPDASLVNRTKNALGRGIGSIMDFASNIPTPMNAIKGFANMRNPLSPTSQNYNPALQGQIDSLTGRRGTLTSGSTTFMSPEDIAAGNFGTKSGSMIVNSSTGKKYGSGSVLSGQNVVSGFGTNDYMGQLEKELDKMKNRAMKKDLTKFQQKKQQDILNEIQAEKDRVANELAISQAAAKAAAASFMSRNPNYGNNYNPDREGGYTGATDSYGDKSGTRQSNARSSDLGFSDIRLKDNIELVGKSPSAINIYNFTYLNDPKVYQGVMAHEVPWASVKHDNGYLMVDYKKVDVDFKAIR